MSSSYTSPYRFSLQPNPRCKMCMGKGKYRLWPATSGMGLTAGVPTIQGCNCVRSRRCYDAPKKRNPEDYDKIRERGLERAKKAQGEAAIFRAKMDQPKGFWARWAKMSRWHEVLFGRKRD